MPTDGRPLVYDPKKDTGQHDVALGVVQQGGHGRVMMTFEHPITKVIWDAENARVFADHLAKAAYEARFGVKPTTAAHQVAGERREQMKHRIAHVARTEAERGRNNIEIADAVLEVILNELM
jgi:hypothetical protein